MPPNSYYPLYKIVSCIRNPNNRIEKSLYSPFYFFNSPEEIINFLIVEFSQESSVKNPPMLNLEDNNNFDLCTSLIPKKTGLNPGIVTKKVIQELNEALSKDMAFLESIFKDLFTVKKVKFHTNSPVGNTPMQSVLEKIKTNKGFLEQALAKLSSSYNAATLNIWIEKSSDKNVTLFIDNILTYIPTDIMPSILIYLSDKAIQKLGIYIENSLLSSPSDLKSPAFRILNAIPEKDILFTALVNKLAKDPKHQDAVASIINNTGLLNQLLGKTKNSHKAWLVLAMLAEDPKHQDAVASIITNTGLLNKLLEKTDDSHNALFVLTELAKDPKHQDAVASIIKDTDLLNQLLEKTDNSHNAWFVLAILAKDPKHQDAVASIIKDTDLLNQLLGKTDNRNNAWFVLAELAEDPKHQDAVASIIKDTDLLNQLIE